MTASAIDHGPELAAGIAAAPRSADLAEHRSAFRRMAYQASMERACRMLLDRGWEADELYYAQLFDLPAGSERASLLQRRDALGLATDPQDYLMCSPTGDRLRVSESSVP